MAGNEGRQEKRPGVSLGGGRLCWVEGVSWQIEFAPSFVFQTGFPTTGARLPGVGSAGAGQRERGQSRAGSLAGLASLQGKLEKSLEHLQKQMEDALLFQAQAEETCSLWQAGGWAPMSRGWGEGSTRALTLEHHRSYSASHKAAPLPQTLHPRGGFALETPMVGLGVRRHGVGSPGGGFGGSSSPSAVPRRRW